MFANGPLADVPLQPLASALEEGKADLPSGYDIVSFLTPADTVPALMDFGL